MRKHIGIIVLIINILIVSTTLVFSGCSNDDFMSVSSVTFTHNGTTRTIYSTWSIRHDKYEKTTKGEYDKAIFKRSNYLTAPGDVTEDNIYYWTNIDDDFHGNIYNINNPTPWPYNITENAIGQYYYISTANLGLYSIHYFKTKILGVSTHIVKLKIVNSTTIIVDNTTYTVTSYSYRQ